MPSPAAGAPSLLTHRHFDHVGAPEDLASRREAPVHAHELELPADRSVPGMPGWCWVHTPGPAPGHVSFWRESDRTLIAGDAFITTARESAYAVAMQRPRLHGPPI